ncbi:MAG: anthranilate synthase component I family protein [Bacteroidia bacterium]|jgi:para-aminobenzoate synthetase component 1|nr:anthranilate synthase component I family protein [Bacteroidia bacterium]
MYQLTETQYQLVCNKAPFWASQFDVALVLDSNKNKPACGLGTYELIIAAGAKHIFQVDTENPFEALAAFRKRHGDWCFGLIAYDAKNWLEELVSNHEDGIGFPVASFFIPQQLVVINNQFQVIKGMEVIAEILETTETPAAHQAVQVAPKVSKHDYIKDVESIRSHIVNGDVYELNYCTEFFAQHARVNPARLMNVLKNISPMPFASYLKFNHLYAIGASPERFVRVEGNTCYSQPIKGTAKRSEDSVQDQFFRNQLLHSEKERAENLMIVDLVRNDLAKSAITGSVVVNELFGIYSFQQVHQMVSTVSATLKPEISIEQCLANIFPMGSMTGAPKIRAMELIEQFERTKRGLYSGTIGYIAPNGEADFNVVIRTIQYNSQSGYLNFEVGSAITYDSDPEAEYEECLLKAKGMVQALQNC